jgi:L-alanine-DL-glutamate epimerase-like enolase superfamily enzyme
VKWGNALAPYRLKWYEEPVDPLDYAGLSEVAQSYEPALATGENLFSLQDSRNLILFGGMRSDRDFLQMDPALSYGLVEYLRILEMLEEQGWSRTRCIPHGGHQFALHIAAGLGIGGNESYPGVFEPFGGFGDGVLPDNGYVKLPGVPGIGIELKSALMRIIREIET